MVEVGTISPSYRFIAAGAPHGAVVKPKHLLPMAKEKRSEKHYLQAKARFRAQTAANPPLFPTKVGGLSSLDILSPRLGGIFWQ